MRKPELLARSKRFAVAILKLVGMLPNRPEYWILGKQLVRSGTSIGANYREAQRARTRPEFISKIHICLQEAEETSYWLELLVEAELIELAKVSALLDEAEQLKAIFLTIANNAQNSGTNDF